MKISSASSQKIKNLSLVCAILVVCIHVPWCQTPVFSLSGFVYNFIAEGIARTAVPFFFVFSGYFLAAHVEERHWWRTETWKRIKSLVVPFYIWSILGACSMLPISFAADLFAHRPLGTSLSLGGLELGRIFGYNCLAFPHNAPLWYLRSLFFLVLTAPVLVMLIRRFRIWWLSIACLLLHFLGHYPNVMLDQFLFVGYSLLGVFYFSIGLYLRLFPVAVCSHNIVLACAFAGGVCLMWRIGISSAGCWLVPHLGRLSVLFLLYPIWHWMPTKPLPNWLTQCSFPIYLMHNAVLDWMSYFLRGYENGATKGFVFWCAAVAIPISITLLFRKVFPRGASICLGGR